MRILVQQPGLIINARCPKVIACPPAQHQTAMVLSSTTALAMEAHARSKELVTRIFTVAVVGKCTRRHFRLIVREARASSQIVADLPANAQKYPELTIKGSAEVGKIQRRIRSCVRRQSAMRRSAVLHGLMTIAVSLILTVLRLQPHRHRSHLTQHPPQHHPPRCACRRVPTV